VSQRDELDDGGAREDRHPERNDVGEVGVDTRGVETEKHGAGRNCNAHLPDDMPHRATMHNEVATTGGDHAARHRPGDDRP
jgi:hypothetical protein